MAKSRYSLRTHPIMSKNIVVLISGRGSNFKAVYERSVQENWPEKYGVRISGVISNRPEAGGLTFAKENNIPFKVIDHKEYPTREAFEEELIKACEDFDADLIVLAGFMRVLTSLFVNAFEGRILNIHPALLPMFPGLHTHERALEAGIRIHGVTVHFVSAVLDGGAIVGQAAVPVLAGDTPDELAARVLKQEHILYPRAVRLVAEGRVRLENGRTIMDRGAKSGTCDSRLNRSATRSNKLESKTNRSGAARPGRRREAPKRHLTDRQRAAKERLARMSPEERRTHDPKKAPNPRMKSTHNGEVRITSLIVDELAKALRKILKLNGPADVLMSLYFKNARHLGPRERTIIAEAIYYTMRHLSMITWRMAPFARLKHRSSPGCSRSRCSTASTAFRIPPSDAKRNL